MGVWFRPFKEKPKPQFGRHKKWDYWIKLCTLCQLNSAWVAFGQVFQVIVGLTGSHKLYKFSTVPVKLRWLIKNLFWDCSPQNKPRNLTLEIAHFQSKLELAGNQLITTHSWSSHVTFNYDARNAILSIHRKSISVRHLLVMLERWSNKKHGYDPLTWKQKQKAFW